MNKPFWIASVAFLFACAPLGISVAEDEPAGEAKDQPAAAEAPPQPYWLGLLVYSVPPEVRAQLALPENQGVIVGSVSPDSPAAAVKLQRHDVLVKIDGQPLTDGHALARAVQESKGKQLSLEVLRGGKTITVEVQPAPRPAAAAPRPEPPEMPPGFPNREALQRWLEKARPGGPGGPPLRFQFIHPGTILPPGARPPAAFPKNLSVTITKQGDTPAKIAVAQGDKKWETTEDRLEKLPAEVRGHVEALLGRHNMLLLRSEPFDWTFVPEPGAAAPGRQPPAGHFEAPVPAPQPAPDRLEQRLDELSRRLEKLQDAIEHLRKDRAEK